MIVLVCGGRKYKDWETVYRVLSAIHNKIPITKIVQGEARGADSLAKQWARENGIPFTSHHRADWETYGAYAGNVRNQKMLDEECPDLVVAFPGGRGTRDMISRAEKRGVRIFVRRA